MRTRSYGPWCVRHCVLRAYRETEKKRESEGEAPGYVRRISCNALAMRRVGPPTFLRPAPCRDPVYSRFYLASKNVARSRLLDTSVSPVFLPSPPNIPPSVPSRLFIFLSLPFLYVRCLPARTASKASHIESRNGS